MHYHSLLSMFVPQYLLNSRVNFLLTWYVHPSAVIWCTSAALVRASQCSYLVHLGRTGTCIPVQLFGAPQPHWYVQPVQLFGAPRPHWYVHSSAVIWCASVALVCASQCSYLVHLSRTGTCIKVQLFGSPQPHWYVQPCEIIWCTSPH